jgi:hypothetical protein
MPKTQLIIRKVLEGRIAHNDGDFAEIETIGTVGIEKNLWLDTIQTHREDTNDTTEGFQRRFPVGTWVDICVSTTITDESGHASAAPTRNLDSPPWGRSDWTLSPSWEEG